MSNNNSIDNINDLVILNNVITILKGAAGSGKSTVAAQVALDSLFKKQIEKEHLNK